MTSGITPPRNIKYEIGNRLNGIDKKVLKIKPELEFALYYGLCEMRKTILCLIEWWLPTGPVHGPVWPEELQ
jgi:hypothetical protein